MILEISPSTWIACLVLLTMVVGAQGDPEDANAPTAALGVATPELLDQKLAGDPTYARDFPGRVRALLAAREKREAALRFLAGAAQARAQRITSRNARWTDRDINEFLTLAFLDPPAFFRGTPEYRAGIFAHLGGCLDAQFPVGPKLQLLQTLAKQPGIDFDAIEGLALAWRIAHRASSERQWVPADQSWQIHDDGKSPVETTWFSFPSRFFEAADCLALLRACRARRPQRNLIALTDHGSLADPRSAGFRAEAAKLRVDLIDPLGREYSPWLRDPFLIATAGQKELVFFCRPNHQAGRESDALAARQVIQSDRRLGTARWAPMPTIFHGGHLVHTPQATWVSAHTVEERVRQLLRQKSFNVADLKQPEIWRRFAATVDEATRELAALCRRPVRFVHPWQRDPTAPDHAAFVDSLSGGNDFDLDVLLTILPAGQPHTVLVGDTRAGAELLDAAPAEDLAAFARRFQIALSPDALRADLRQYQQTARIRLLQSFLELVTRHFQAQGLRVLRTPLLLIPTRLTAGHKKFAADQPHQHFPLGFSNVVLETSREEGPCAEGFGSGLPTFDRAAQAVFTEAGYRLTLYPPLVESIICEGGYRCTTQEIRAPAR